MGSFEDIFGAWTEGWELESYGFATDCKELPFATEVSIEDLGKLKWSGNCTPAFEGQNSPWWQDNGSKCPFSLSSEDNGKENLEISSSVTHSCSDNSPSVPMGNNMDCDNNLEQVFNTCFRTDELPWDPLWGGDDGYHSVISFGEDAVSEKGTFIPKEISLPSPTRRRKQVETFSIEQLKDLKGSTSAEGRRMTAEERALMLYKRKLRNRNSAARSRRRRTLILNEINDQVSSLKSLIKKFQGRLYFYERGGSLSTFDSRLEEIRTNLFTQLERLLSVEYQVAVLRAKLMGTKVKGKFSMESNTERSMSFTSV